MKAKPQLGENASLLHLVTEGANNKVLPNRSKFLKVIIRLYYNPRKYCKKTTKISKITNSLRYLNKNINYYISASKMQPNSRYKTNNMSKYDTEDAWISDLDPLMEGGFKVAFYEPQFALEVRTTSEDGQPSSTKQINSLRILSLNSGDGITELKIEISSEEDLFKLYVCKLDEKSFEKIKKTQHLNFSFQSLIPMLIKQITLCQKHINQYSAVLYLNKISAHRLDLLQNIEYKRIQLLSLQFQELDEQAIKNYVTFRFTKVRMNKQIIQKKLKDVMSITKLKNQNLWADIIKKQTSRFTK